jgi:SHS2 domain-containing protein
MSYTFLSHTADVKFRAEGNSLEEMFISATEALIHTIRGDIKILDLEEKTVKIEGSDMENLLYNFLEEILFLLDSEDFLLSKIKSIEINKEKFQINATLMGDRAEKYVFTNDVKAITYNGMFVREENGKWICEVVLDV